MRDTNVGVGATDGRRIGVLTQDLPCFGRAQLAVGVTLRCALTRTGEPHPHAADVDGAVLVKARHDKETTYPEPINSGRCRFVAIETSGRWSDDAVEFIRLLACAKRRKKCRRTSGGRPLWRGNAAGPGRSPLHAPCRLRPPCVTWCRTGEPPSLAELVGQDPR